MFHVCCDEISGDSQIELKFRNSILLLQNWPDLATPCHPWSYHNAGAQTLFNVITVINISNKQFD